MRAALALCAFAAAAAALPSLRRRMAIEENQPREHTAIYVWDKAVWFAPHGHDPAEPPDEWTRRRLGDYENDYDNNDKYHLHVTYGSCYRNTANTQSSSRPEEREHAVEDFPLIVHAGRPQ